MTMTTIDFSPLLRSMIGFDRLSNALETAYASTLGLRLAGRLITRRFAWTCLALFVAALLSLQAVDSSRRPAAREIPVRAKS